MNLQYVAGLYAMLTYLTQYLYKPEHKVSEPMKKASKEAYGKDVKGNMLCTGNTFLTKRELSLHEAIKRVLSLPMRHSNIYVLYAPIGLKKNRTRMLKWLSILEKMYPDDTNVFASNIIDKHKNRPDNLHSICLADFTSSYVTKKADDFPIESDEIESYTLPVSNINDFKLVRNELGEMRKPSQPCLTRFHKVSKLKSPEEHYLKPLQLYLP